MKYISRYKLTLRALAAILICLFFFNNVSIAGDSIGPARDTLSSKLFLSDAEKREQFQAELICELIEKRADYGKKPENIYLGDIFLWEKLKKKGDISFANTELKGCKIDLSGPYEIRISVPSSNIIVRYFDPNKANKNTPFASGAVSKTVPINANLHRQIIRAAKTLPAPASEDLRTGLKKKVKTAAIEQLIESTVNPYWKEMKVRLEALRAYIDKIDPCIISELQNSYDVYSNWETLGFKNAEGKSYEAKVFRVRVKNNIVLGAAKGGMRYCTGSGLMNEKTGILAKTLDKLSELGAVKKQVEAFVAKWVSEEAQALSLGMTLKNSSSGLDLGGGKGAVFKGYAAKEEGKWVLKDYDNFRDGYNLAKTARSHSIDLAKAGKVGIGVDIPAPDLDTNPQILAWYEDEYLKYIVEKTPEIQNFDFELYRILKAILDKGEYGITETPLLEAASNYSKLGHAVPWLGVYTGKPVELGGSLGRTEATGFGCTDVMRALIDLKEKTVSVQGFGNVGAHVALSLAKEGAIIQYINDHTITLYKKEGFSVEELERMVKWVNTRPREKWLVDYYTQGKIKAQTKGSYDPDGGWTAGLDERTGEALGAEVDILVPAALEHQIRLDNVGVIKAKIVVEAANGPTTSEAENILYEREVPVIHDTLVNAGGVIVSSFETEQAVMGKWYDAQQVGARRRQALERAARLTKDVMKKYGIKVYRIAGDIAAVLRIAREKQINALWENTFLRCSDKLRLDRNELIKRLRARDREAHNIFRYMLTQIVLDDLTKTLNVVKNVWLFGNTEYSAAGPASDIDLIIEVTSEEEKERVYGYFRSLNSRIGKKFNKVMEGTGIKAAGLFDVEAKVFVREEIEKKQGFAAAIKSVYTPVSLVYPGSEFQAGPFRGKADAIAEIHPTSNNAADDERVFAATQGPAELLKALTSENWVERRNAADEIGKRKIEGAEKALIYLLDDPQFQVVESAARNLSKLKSNLSVPTLIKTFGRIKDNDFSRGSQEAVIEALGQSNSEEAMLFLGEILTGEESKSYQRTAAARSLAFYADRRAVEFLISSLKPDMSPVTKSALISLSQIAGVEDIEKINDVITGISLEPPSSLLQKAIESEGFGDSSRSLFLSYFISGCIGRIKGRVANKALAVGWLEGIVDMERYEEAYYSMQEELNVLESVEQRNLRKSWKNKYIAGRYISDKAGTKLIEKAFHKLPSGKDHPDVQAVIDTLEANDVFFYRSKTGIRMEQDDLRLVQWAKDGSVLIPALKGFIPFSLPSQSFPVCGETAVISGRNPLLLVSESNVTSIRLLNEMFPDIDTRMIPPGFITIKLSNGQIVLQGTSHIDCVINVMPAETTKEGIPIVLIDPHYYKELTMSEWTSRLLMDIEEKYEAKIVVIPDEEAYLNPANFMLIDKNRILLNYAPETRKELLRAGMKAESLIMMDREITSLAPLKGMIGCLGGIYRQDRLVIDDMAGKARISKNRISKNAYYEFMDGNEAVIKAILAGSHGPVLHRIPVEPLKFMSQKEIERIKGFLVALQNPKNSYVEFYSMPGSWDINMPDKLKTVLKTVPDDVREKCKKEKNIITLLPVEKGKKIDRETIQTCLAAAGLGFENTVLSPIGFKDSPAGLVRGAIFGFGLLHIARQNNGLGKLDRRFIKEFVSPMCNQYKILCESLGIKHFDLIPNDIINLATGGINEITKAINKLIKLLPITPIDPEELKEIFQYAAKKFA